MRLSHFDVTTCEVGSAMETARAIRSFETQRQQAVVVTLGEVHGIQLGT